MAVSHELDNDLLCSCDFVADTSPQLLAGSERVSVETTVQPRLLSAVQLPLLVDHAARLDPHLPALPARSPIEMSEWEADASW